MPTREATKTTRIELGGVLTRTVGIPPAGFQIPADAIWYPPGAYGDITLSTSDVYITAEAGATFGTITVDDVDNVTLDGLTMDYIKAENTGFATNCTVRRCTGKGVHLNTAATGAGIPAPSGWTIEYNDLTGGSYCLLVKSHGPGYPTLYNTLIQHNRLGNPTTDAIQCAGYDGLTVYHNEFFGVIETGAHNDGLQSVWGGANMTFTHNYWHHNRCQPFFIKDGYVDTVVLAENLSIYNREPGLGASVTNIYQVSDLTMYNNTFWDGAGFLLRDGQNYETEWPNGPLGPMEIHHNVIDVFTPLDAATYLVPGVLDEHDNVFGGGWSWVPGNMGPGSIQDASPDFVDWQISGYGITWNPAEQVYGVAAFPS